MRSQKDLVNSTSSVQFAALYTHNYHCRCIIFAYLPNKALSNILVTVFLVTMLLFKVLYSLTQLSSATLLAEWLYVPYTLVLILLGDTL